MEGNKEDRLRKLDHLQREVEVSLASVLRHVSAASDSVDNMTKRINRLAEKVESGEPRFQELLASQLRMGQILSSIQSMLDRQSQ
jgi:hypothetical protein